MKAWLVRCSIASAVFFAFACGDDDSTLHGADAGQGGEPGDASGGDSGAPSAPRCEPPDSPAGAGGAGSTLSIVGTYEDNFGGEHVITASTWMSGSSVYHVSDFDDVAGWLIARNDQDNTYSPCLWSRFDWTEAESKLYFCQTAYDAPSEAFARELEPPDPSNPTETGCGSFSWSELTPE